MTATQSDELLDRSIELQDEYTHDLDAFTNKLVPPMLANDAYAARCSALMIALNRQLARCAAAFGEVHGLSPVQMQSLVMKQFGRNYGICIDALQGEGQEAN